MEDFEQLFAFSKTLAINGDIDVWVALNVEAKQRFISTCQLPIQTKKKAKNADSLTSGMQDAADKMLSVSMPRMKLIFTSVERRFTHNSVSRMKTRKATKRPGIFVRAGAEGMIGAMGTGCVATGKGPTGSCAGPVTTAGVAIIGAVDETATAGRAATGGCG
ncbi:hypothetical protein RB195_026514 [Necator americanus]|uniref:Uncharacterized protein n=1 Tax=Necator americanus TaxID=51031 RepID=A0ABR1EX97_NECAM